MVRPETGDPQGAALKSPVEGSGRRASPVRGASTGPPNSSDLFPWSRMTSERCARLTQSPARGADRRCAAACGLCSARGAEEQPNEADQVRWSIRVVPFASRALTVRGATLHPPSNSSLSIHAEGPQNVAPTPHPNRRPVRADRRCVAACGLCSARGAEEQPNEADRVRWNNWIVPFASRALLVRGAAMEGRGNRDLSCLPE